MNFGFYPKLALDGMRKNKRLYLPYCFTGSVMVMMFYILSSILESPSLSDIAGGTALSAILPLGCGVIAIFSLLFLFYTHSFLIKQRAQEFGLYNILGMNKRNISRVMAWESILTAVIAVLVGLAAGIALAKAAELVLLNLLKMEITFSLRIGLLSMGKTALLFGGIYLLLLVYACVRVRISKPLELMQSSKVGEKVPRFTGFFGLLGAVLLGVAYYLSLSIDEPATALFTFFLAVILVILGTYLLFLSGSVAFCRLLQKNKNYYYKPNHFVPIASMVYRMKRNGAGLASICILLTMVLVMISSSASLYFGEEDSVQNRYPNGINLKIYYNSMEGICDENLNTTRERLAPYCPAGTDLSGTRYSMVPGLFTEEGITIDYGQFQEDSGLIIAYDYDKVGYLFVLSLDDYNHMMNQTETLEDDQCLIYSKRLTTQWDTFTMESGSPYRVKAHLTEFREDNDALAMTMPSVYLVVKDVATFSAPAAQLKNENGHSLMEYTWLCGFDAPSVHEELVIQDNLSRTIAAMAEESDLILTSYVDSREMQRAGFFEIYGSLFFLGIMLSIVFLLAAVLIIYYKQISEGYEDQSRFDIMQKVGMTKRDIRQSINSQMLTVFFLPLLLAGLHLAFAFPFVSRILLLFAFDNTPLNITINLICFAVFGLFYAVVYKITSGSYYMIVSGGRQ